MIRTKLDAAKFVQKIQGLSEFSYIIRTSAFCRIISIKSTLYYKNDQWYLRLQDGDYLRIDDPSDVIDRVWQHRSWINEVLRKERRNTIKQQNKNKKEGDNYYE